MTVTVDSTGTGSAADETFAAAATLTALAAAYQAGQNRIATYANRAATDSWLRARPITDSDLAAWMVTYNRIMSAAAGRQQQLTASYAQAQLARFGVTYRPSPRIADTGLARTAQEWLDGPYGSFSPLLRAQVEQAAEALVAGRATVGNASLIDRTANLHSPVVKQRWRVSEGNDFDLALVDTVSDVETYIDVDLREVERLTMDNVGWPTFKNGTAMLYRRMPQAGACGWCRIVSTRLYSFESFRRTGGRASGDSARWHVRCRCTWVAVPYRDAVRYDEKLKGTKGDYYAAAREIGLWDGDAPPSWADWLRDHRFDPTSATGAGYTPGLPLTAAERADAIARDWLRPARNPRRRRAASTQPATVVLSAVQQRQVARLDATVRDLNAAARAAVAAGNRTRSQRLYQQARRYSRAAYELRTGTA